MISSDCYQSRNYESRLLLVLVGCFFVVVVVFPFLFFSLLLLLRVFVFNFLDIYILCARTS